MDLMEFTGAVGRLSGEDIRSVSLAIAAHRTCAEEEVRWWVTTLAVERLVQLTGRERLSAVAGLRASAAVLGAARRAGIALPNPDVSRVARSATHVAHALVGGKRTKAELAYFLGCWHGYLPSAGRSPSPSKTPTGAARAAEPTEVRPAAGGARTHHLPAAVPL